MAELAYTQGLKYKSAVNSFTVRLRFLHSRVMYRATSRLRIILASPRLSTFVSLVHDYIKASKHFCFSSFLNLEQSGTRPEPRAIGRLVPAFRSLFSIRLIWSYISDAHVNIRGHTSSLPPTRCTWTRFLSSMPPTQFTRYVKRDLQVNTQHCLECISSMFAVFLLLILFSTASRSCSVNLMSGWL